LIQHNIPNGQLRLKVIAYDTLSQSTTQEVLVYVNNVAGDEPPQVHIISPQNNEIVKGIIQVGYIYNDDKNVVKLELYINNNYLTDLPLSATYYLLDTRIFTDSSYVIKIIAYDDVN